jgi:hypothetical protein
MMIYVTRTIAGAVAPQATSTIATDDLADRIIDDYRVFMAQMKCAMSERLVRLGISMAQLNIMYTLQRNGEMPMSRLADVLNVSLSNASGLVDRMEERGSSSGRAAPKIAESCSCASRRLVPRYSKRTTPATTTCCGPSCTGSSRTSCRSSLG